MLDKEEDGVDYSVSGISNINTRLPTQPATIAFSQDLDLPYPYAITYTAVDSYGTAATPMTRFVHVRSPCDSTEFWCMKSSACS